MSTVNLLVRIDAIIILVIGIKDFVRFEFLNCIC